MGYVEEFLSAPSKAEVPYKPPRACFQELATTNHVPRLLAVIADDHESMRAKIRELLSPLVDVVASVADGRSALEAVDKHDPDLVVLDISMPELNGLEVARELNRRRKKAKIIFVSLDESEHMRKSAQLVGGIAYVTKARLNADLVKVIMSLSDLP